MRDSRDIYNIYDKIVKINNNEIEKIIEEITEEIGKDATKEEIKILDLGIGTGTWSLPLFLSICNKYNSVQWVGIDNDNGARGFFFEKSKSFNLQRVQSKKEYDKYTLNGINNKVLYWCYCDMERIWLYNIDLPINNINIFRPNLYQIIFALDFFHHLLFWEQCLEKVIKLLENNGVLVEAILRKDTYLTLGRFEYVNADLKAKVWREVFAQLPLYILREFHAAHSGSLRFFLEKFCKFEKKDLDRTPLEFKASVKDWLEAVRKGVFSPFKFFRKIDVSEIVEEIEQKYPGLDKEEMNVKMILRLWKKP